MALNLGTILVDSARDSVRALGAGPRHPRARARQRTALPPGRVSFARPLPVRIVRALSVAP